jgi:hypothetical protein
VRRVETGARHRKERFKQAGRTWKQNRPFPGSGSKQKSATATVPEPPHTSKNKKANTIDSTLQAHIDKARAYQRQIDELARSNANPQIQSNVREMAVQVEQWTNAVEELAYRINRFQQNDLIQQDLTTVPQAIHKLETRLSNEQDPTTRAEIERALQNRHNQWHTLKSLQNTMARAEIKIENTLSLLGTLYPQILSSQSTNQVSDYSRITGEVSEEVRVLKDHLEALEEVKLGQANNYTG